MLDENLIATLEQSLRQTRNAQNRLMARLREVENEAEHLRQEIEALENSAAQTEQAIDSLLVTMRAGTRSLNLGRTIRIEDDFESGQEVRRPIAQTPRRRNTTCGG
jgi:predicted  nucleic acid-binding Zn-ribbon protein